MNRITMFLIKIPFIKRWMDKKVEIIENTNPDAIKVEDISKFWHLPKTVAKHMCEMACRQNLYSKNEDGTYKLIEQE